MPSKLFNVKLFIFYFFRNYSRADEFNAAIE